MRIRKLVLAVLLIVAALAVPAAVTGQGENTETYTVQPGDSLWKISLKYEVGLSEIIAANPQFRDPNWIYPGDRVIIPLHAQMKAVELRIVELVNQERARNGLRPLGRNWELSRVARYKSEDMRDNQYFSHTSPTYGSPFDMIRSFRVSFRAAGENIAAGQQTAEQVMNSWMASPGHRQNILSEQYSEIGVGYASGGTRQHYWTQMFIHP